MSDRRTQRKNGAYSIQQEYLVGNDVDIRVDNHLEMQDPATTELGARQKEAEGEDNKLLVEDDTEGQFEVQFAANELEQNDEEQEDLTSNNGRHSFIPANK